MIVRSIRTPKLHPGETTISQLLDQHITELTENSLVVITSKIVSLCENRVVPAVGTNRKQLLQDESELYFVPNAKHIRPYNFTIKQNTLIPASGIDVSNGDGHYILWPHNSHASARIARDHLARRHNLTNIGVIITDSTIGLSRWGTLGIAIGHSGFRPVKNYIGQPDLFGKTLALSKANVAGGLASAAVLVMGEGAEQTPLAVISDISFVEFVDPRTGSDHADTYYISPLNDQPFAPFFQSVEWHKGGSYGATDR